LGIYLLLFAAAVTAAVERRCRILFRLRIECRNRELKTAENLTGRFSHTNSRRRAVFAVNAVVISRNDYRNGTREGDNREETESNIKHSLVVFAARITAAGVAAGVASAAGIAGVASAACVAAATAAAGVAAGYVRIAANARIGSVRRNADKFCFKQNRIYNIESSFGCGRIAVAAAASSVAVFLLVAAAVCEAFGQFCIGRSVDFRGAFRTVKNCLFAPNSGAAKCCSAALVSASSNLAVGFCNNFELKGYINAVITFFEGKRINGQTYIFNFNTFASDNGKVVGNLGSAVRQRYRQIADTITVCAAVKDPLNFNANRFFKAVVFFVHVKVLLCKY
jgi:hypothetical protein